MYLNSNFANTLNVCSGFSLITVWVVLCSFEKGFTAGGYKVSIVGIRVYFENFKGILTPPTK